MNLTLERRFYTAQSTEGQMLVDGQFLCYTLELPFSDGQPGGAIPEGTFSVMVTESPKFGRPMPLIVGIPDRSEIRIHWGNTAEDTEGCVILGRTQSPNFVGESRLAFDAFWEMTNAAMRAGNCRITVRRGTPVPSPAVSMHAQDL